MAKHHGGVQAACEPVEAASVPVRPERGRRQDRTALDEMVGVHYHDLLGLAATQRRRWRADDTLEATALCHEAYLKLAAATSFSWTERAHFLSVAARAMRQILIDRSRAEGRAKRGGLARASVSLEEVEVAISASPGLDPERTEELAILAEGLRALQRESPRQADIVGCRFFEGMTISETAEVMRSSPSTVKREWARAQNRLFRFMTDAGFEH